MPPSDLPTRQGNATQAHGAPVIEGLREHWLYHFRKADPPTFFLETAESRTHGSSIEPDVRLKLNGQAMHDR